MNLEVHKIDIPIALGTAPSPDPLLQTCSTKFSAFQEVLDLLLIH